MIRRGTALDSDLYCSECGNKTGENDRYCLKCGAELGTSSPTPRPRPSAQESSPARSTTVPWKWFAVAGALLLILGGISIIVALNWSPEEKLGTVEAPTLDPSLAGGGLSSREIGSDLLIQSLESSEPIGYQILQDAVDENVIDDFTQVPPTGNWTSEFRMNGSDFKLQFENKNNFVLRYPVAQKNTADQIFTIGSRYGFLSTDASPELNSLTDRTVSLLDAFDARQLTIGVAESDLAGEATTLVSDWDAWIQKFGGESPDAELAQAKRDLIAVVAEVSANPSNPGLDEYRAAIGRYNQAVDAYNSGG